MLVEGSSDGWDLPVAALAECNGEVWSVPWYSPVRMEEMVYGVDVREGEPAPELLHREEATRLPRSGKGVDTP